MATSIETIRRQMIQALIVAFLSPVLPLAGTSSPGLERNHKAPSDKHWQVKNMGAVDPWRRGMPMDLRVSEEAITYGAVGCRPSQWSSIPVVDVNDVSDAVIERDLSEKVFGPGDPDCLSPCDSAGDREAASACALGGLALETPVAIVASVLQSIPFNDRLIRIAWRQQGGNPQVVFKVCAKDLVALREELEGVTAKPRGHDPQPQAGQATIYHVPIKGIDEFDCKAICQGGFKCE